jgi:hypothetical protein
MKPLLATALLLATAAAAQTVEPQGELTYPVSARVVLPEGQKLAAGAYARVQVKIRNTTTEAGRHQVAMPLQAVVLRYVSWDKGIERSDWLRSIYGSTKQNPDGSVEHNTVAQQMTDLRFETGLLLPGEEITVELPFTPQTASAQLKFGFAVVPGDFESQVLLAEPISPVSPGKVTVRYLPYSTAGAQARERTHGVALVKATMSGKPPALRVDDSSLAFQLPLQSDPPLTGGLSREQAIAQCGPAAGAQVFAYFREPLHAWFVLVAQDKDHGTWTALVNQAGKWLKKPLPMMRLEVPEVFATDQPVDAKLPPELLGAFPPQPPAPKPDPAGTVSLPPTTWWTVLNLAQRRNYWLHLGWTRHYASEQGSALVFEKLP